MVHASLGLLARSPATKSPRWRLVVTMIAVALGLPGSGMAQTARLTGRVIDGDTSTPVTGASIRIVALDLEAVTTSTGRFVLAGIPAGTHDVTIDLLGYTSLRLLGVEFRAGRPTELAIRLEPSPVALAPIVVEADRIPLIEPEVSETREIIPGRVLRELPVTRIGEVIDLATGVSDGHFRGGQVGQEVYLVDGFALKNQLEATTGGASIELAPTSLREIEIVTGGFNSEYGSALSGVVSYRTRSGAPERWEGSVTLRGDHLAPAAASTGFTAFNIHGGGPVSFLGERATLFADLHLEGLNDADPRARGLRCLRTEDADDELAAAMVALQSGPGGSNLSCPFEDSGLPGQLGDRLIGFLRFDSPGLGGLFSVSILHNRFQRGLYTPEFKYNAASGLGQRTRATLAALNYESSSQTRNGANHLTIRVAAQQLDRYLGAVDRRALSNRNTLAGFGLSDIEFLGEDFARSPIEDQLAEPQAIPGYVQPAGRIGSPFGPAAEGIFVADGTTGIANWTRSSLLGADVVGEMLFVTGASFRGGFSGRLHRVEVYERTRAWLAGSAPNFARFFPATLSGFVEANLRPEELFTVNVGVRVEAFRNGLEFRADRSDFLTPVIDTEWNVNFGPRIGFAGAFRNSSGRTAFRVSWARMAQPPDFQFFLDSTIGDSLRTDISRQGNPQLSFEEGSTIELGISHQFGHTVGLEIVGFHKALGKLLTGSVQLVGTTPGQFTTGDEGTVNGAEISGVASFPDVLVRLGYSLQKATGLTAGSFADTGAVMTGRPEPVPLVFDRRHTIDATILLGRSARAASQLDGGFPVGATVTARVRSGYPLFPLLPEDGSGAGIPIGRLPWTALVDLALTWNLPGVPGCHGCTARVILEAKNLLDRDNIIALRRETGTIAPTLSTVERLVAAPHTSRFPIIRESEFYTASVDLDDDGLITEDEFDTARFAAAVDRFDPSLFYGPASQVRIGLQVSF